MPKHPASAGLRSDPAIIETDIPSRLDRLFWSPFHTLVVTALGIAWVLDGLEVTLAGSVSGALARSPVLHFSDGEIGFAASAYLTGAVLGALFFGWLTDRLGRKRLFSLTLGLYLVATALSACAWDFWSFALLRAFTGAGIGGEYAAINSAIQELVPARYRGRTDLFVNGSFWLGAGLGAGAAVLLLAPGLLPIDLGWRLAFGVGAVLGLVILVLRHWVPESPRWLMTKGRVDEAEDIMRDIERRSGGAGSGATHIIRLHRSGKAVSPLDLFRSLIRIYPQRTIVAVILMASQAFFYNAIFFTYPLVLGRFYGVSADRIGLYILPFALGNFAGPLLLGKLFDSVGRRPMIAGTYAASGILLCGLAFLFVNGTLDATGQTIGWSVIFFFASATASGAYLTIGESFPLEVRALAIALFYALGTGLGGIAGPALFGHLIGTGERSAIGWGYGFAAALMVVAAGVELWLGFAAEGRSLEDIAQPLASAE